MANYRSNAGDLLDAIVFGHYGQTNARLVERVLEVNPNLARLGPTLPDGVMILLPELDMAEKKQGLRLWD